MGEDSGIRFGYGNGKAEYKGGADEQGGQGSFSARAAPIASPKGAALPGFR